MLFVHPVYDILHKFVYKRDRFSVSGKGEVGGGEWVHLKGANSMAVSELGCRKALVGNGRAILCFSA